MSLSEQHIQAALKEVVDPNTGKDLVSSRCIKNVKVSGADVSLDVELGYPAKSQIDGIRKSVIEKLKTLAGIGNRITVNFEHRGKVVIDGSQIALMRVFDT